jgi:hypothetical protein
MRRPAPPFVAFSGLAIAFVAAAIGDALMETISNTGLFGSTFIDHDQQSVVPLLVASILLGLLLLAARLQYAAALAGTASRDWVREAVAGLSIARPSRQVAPIFAVQLAAVYAMESCEHALGAGAAIHGLSWLGGPVALSLLLHLTVCLLCIAVVRRVTRALVPGLLAAICDVLDWIVRALGPGAARGVFVNSRARVARHGTLTAAERIRGRAPPFLTALV